MNWTKEKPDKEGWYWVRYYDKYLRPGGAGFRIIIVSLSHYCNTLNVLFAGSDVDGGLEDLDKDGHIADWFGPLEVPEFKE
jgi:hypothetical protein